MSILNDQEDYYRSIVVIDRSIEDLEKTKEILCSVGYQKRLQSSSKPYIKRSEFIEWLSQKYLWTVANVISRLAVLAETKVYLLWKRSIDGRQLPDGVTR